MLGVHHKAYWRKKEFSEVIWTGALKMFVGRTFDSAYATGQYASVLIHIEDLGVHSKNSDIKGPAKHVSVEMKNIHFVAYCHFLADLFSILGCLSLQMQRDNIILPTAVSHLKETITQVECLRNIPRDSSKRFSSRTNQAWEKYIRKFPVWNWNSWESHNTRSSQEI